MGINFSINEQRNANSPLTKYNQKLYTFSHILFEIISLENRAFLNYIYLKIYLMSAKIYYRFLMPIFFQISLYTKTIYRRYLQQNMFRHHESLRVVLKSILFINHMLEYWSFFIRTRLYSPQSPKPLVLLFRLVVVMKFWKSYPLPFDFFVFNVIFLPQMRQWSEKHACMRRQVDTYVCVCVCVAQIQQMLSIQNVNMPHDLIRAST